MTTTRMCKELYAADPGFRGFIACWVDDMRCPYPLADFLREHDLHSQAAFAEWAATEPDRYDITNSKGMHGIFPDYDSADDGRKTYKSYWYWLLSDTDTAIADTLPASRIRHKDSFSDQFASAEDAILWALDNWIP